ncbi:MULTISPECIES: carbohydrate ABC transporter permease [unclassified Frigoribacterium]|jgi:multiple sugar transport system permease protein|uniref:carbohydrate ABC transporter permease n=1 Tax=unclassified Frigoribacterium TaxID=2627005 RepID=UPI0007002D00|nr:MULTISPECIES: carbohydrate ABC transporter permease [unclassified Frigoribacterium]KQS17170.1 sugar ABC transporter permease [Frigoribacterium sp. Leaf186]MBF4600894.1 carbohydrate ABC transporter permease [Frigoribacterium sp. VKM Ac-1396]NRD26774.1 carbohydrate ABC transporter permease [Frigoribacterium sp. VKM Ac-2836]ROS50516.1 carbohydrate ABC transporter membrane protein 2 (CUT1 family) [Frigoribacterium sp. PhB24]
MAMTSPSGRSMKAVSNVVLIVIAICFAVPLAWLLLASFDPSATLSAKVPSQFTLDNFTAVLTPEISFVPLANSLIVSGGCALVTVVVAILAAYPLSRYRMRINKPFLYGILFGTGLPITAMMVPVYSLFVSLNLIDSIGGTVFFLAATSLPMAIWMAKNFMDSVPISLEEAAWTDGASMFSTLTRIVVPLMRPGIAVVFIFVFIQAWGNFFVPFVLLLSPDKQPAAVSIFNFFGQYGSVAYGQLAAFSIVYSVPVIALYVLVSRTLGGSNALAGAVKG